MDLMSRPPLAGIGARFAAVLLDGLMPSLISIPAAITGYVMASGLTTSPPSFPGETMQIFGIFVLGLTILGFQCYSALVLALWASGPTPGMWVMGIRVIKADTSLSASFWRMALRQLIGRMISAIV